MEFLNKLKNGEFGLAKTYWLYGVIVAIPLNIIIEYIGLNTITFNILFLIEIAYFYFWILGCWKAASEYEGSAPWPFLTKLFCIITVIYAAYETFGVLISLLKPIADYLN